MNLNVTIGDAIILANLAMLDADDWKSKSEGRSDADIFMAYHFSRKELSSNIRKQVEALEMNKPSVPQPTPQITVDMVDAIKVQFLKPIFEDDFAERGMTAWLTKIEWAEREQCYKLYFDFSEFEAENEKYFSETYWANSKTALLPKKSFYTAKEAGYYNKKLSTYFSDESDTQNPESFAREIVKYLKVV